MKILTLFVLLLTFYCVMTKEANSAVTKDKKAEKAENTEKSKIINVENMPDSVTTPFATNDPYLLQHQAVN